jgi:hypothetical protein
VSEAPRRTPPKTQLTPHEKVQAYLANRHRGVDQHDIAAMYGPINSARVTEAIMAIEYAIENTLEVYGLAKAARAARRAGS